MRPSGDGVELAHLTTQARLMMRFAWIGVSVAVQAVRVCVTLPHNKGARRDI